MLDRQNSRDTSGQRGDPGFVRGLTRPSVVSAATALCVLCAAFVAYCTILGPGFLASDKYRLLMSNPLDTHTLVGHRVLSRAGSSGANAILLGTSVTIRCIEGEAPLAERIEARTGRRLRVDDLATDAQATWEMAALVDRLPPQDGGVLVIGLTPGLLSANPLGDSRNALGSLLKWPRFGFTSPAMEAEARALGVAVPRRTGIYAIDNAGYILSRRKELLRNLLRGGTDYADPLTAAWYKNVNTPEFWAKEIRELPEVAAEYRANAALNFDMLDRMVLRALQSHDFRVVVLESPVNPGWWQDEAGARFYRAYRADLAALAGRLGGTFVQISDRAGLKQSDFVDYEGHLGNAAARARCSDALADGIAAALEGGA